MKKYNYEKIDELIQPLMTMMQEEYPNGFKLIIEPHFARIVYEHDEMLFKSDEMKNTPLNEVLFGDGFGKAMFDAIRQGAEKFNEAQGKEVEKV